MVKLSTGTLALALTAGIALAWAPPATAQRTSGLSNQLDEAERKLDADIKACRPINVNDYLRLQSQATANFRAAERAQKAGLPVDVQQVVADTERATTLVDRAQAAADKPCPPPQQQPTTTAPPQTNPPPPPPVDQPAGGFVAPRTEPPHDLLDELERQADDAASDYWTAFRHCDKDGMKRALDKIRDIADQVHDIHEAATAAGAMGRFSKSQIEDMVDFEDDLFDFIDEARFDVPRCPVPQQSSGRTGQGCPPSTPLPQESLLRQPLKVDFGYVPRLTGTRYSQQILDYHNSLRAGYGVQPVAWNPAFAMEAGIYAKTMADLGTLAHSPRTGREGERENLSLSLHGTNTLQHMLDGWGMEARYYKQGVFPDVSTTGNWMDVGHFTQMVWPMTTQIGCGFYAGRKYDALVCRYAPPGNTDGRALVLRPLSDCRRQEELERGE